MPRVVWSRSFEGEVSSLALGEGLIYLGRRGGELVALDLAGDTRWKRASSAPVTTLRDRHVLVRDGDQHVHVLDHEGRSLSRTPGPIDHAARNGPRLLLADATQVYFAGEDLAVTAHGPRPDGWVPGEEWILDDSFLWVRENTLMRWKSGEHQRVFDAPLERIAEAVVRWRARTGRAEDDGLSGWDAMWHVAVDPARGLCFLTSRMSPHVAVCATLEGDVRWCEVLHGACCGSPVHPLPDGDYVCSESCGGVLVWFDVEGRVLRESERDLALGYEVHVTPSSRVVVKGSTRVDGFGRDREQTWRLERSHRAIACDRAGTFFVGVRDETNRRGTWVELVDELW